jgi:hypothetical protein
MLSITHNAGFFSCCSVKICKIINYFTEHTVLPSQIDGSRLFHMYKIDRNIDITHDFFTDPNDITEIIKYDKKISIDRFNFQFENYKTVDYQSIIPFVKKYFTPSTQIVGIYRSLVTKYSINDNNCIGLYYRGTDKCSETKLDSFDSYYIKLLELVMENKNIQILIQTDTRQFIDYIKTKPLRNVIIIDENSTSSSSKGIHKEKTPAENYVDIQTLFATFLLISKCKYIICSSGNCSIWMMYYRGHANNVYQSLNRSWL